MKLTPVERMDPQMELLQRVEALRRAMGHLAAMPPLRVTPPVRGQEVGAWFGQAATEIERWSVGVNECRDKMQRALEGGDWD